MEYRRAAGARRVGRNARRARGRKQAERKGDVRMKKTKLAALFLALAMLIAALAGCTSTTPADSGESADPAAPAEEPAAESPPSHGRLDKNLVQDKE